MLVPAGVMCLWPSTNGSIPSGWSRETTLDAKFVKHITMTTVGVTGTNSTFEVSIGSWAPQGSNTIARSTVQAHGGSASGLCTYGNGGGGDSNCGAEAITLTAKPYTLSGWVYIPAGYDGTQVAITLEGFTSATGTQAAGADIGKRDQWQYVTGTITPNAGTLTASIVLRLIGCSNTKFVYFDDIKVTLDPNSTGGATTHIHTPNATHVHDLTHSHTGSGSSGAGSGSATGGATGTSNATATHTHTKPSLGTSGAFDSGATTPGDSGTTSNDPSNLVVIWIKSDGTPLGFPNSCLVFFNSDTLPASWTRYANSQNNFLKGAAAAGDGGGTNAGSVTHTHTGAAHVHTGTSHTHTANASGAASAGFGNVVVQARAPIAHTHTPTVGSSTSGVLDSIAADTSGNGTNEPPYYKLNIIQNGVGAADWPRMVIAGWLGQVADIPYGWGLCDGTNSSPNVLDKFIKGCNANGELGNTGGALTHTHSAGAGHSHTVQTHLHALTHVNTASSGNGNSSGTNVATTTHTHTWGNSDNDSTSSSSVAAATLPANGATSLPPYVEIALIQWQLQQPLDDIVRGSLRGMMRGGR